MLLFVDYCQRGFTLLCGSGGGEVGGGYFLRHGGGVGGGASFGRVRFLLFYLRLFQFSGRDGYFLIR